MVSLVACLTAVSCGGAVDRPRAASETQAGGAEPRSNVSRADYAGSDACSGCHAQIYAAWRRSPMHRMTRELAHSEISAPFDGRQLKLGADVATLLLRDGQRFMALSQPGGESLFRVTKVVGGRYREDFVGEQVALEAPLGKALEEQRVLPFSFLRFDGTLRYKGYSVMVP